MANIRYAEDANYWDTTVSPAKSLGEIQELLDGFGVENMMVSQGKSGNKLAWMIRFEWLNRAYRFVFIPLTCRYPNQVNSYGGKRQTHEEHSKFQMGRIAVNWVKAMLTAAEINPDALFGFMELPGARPGAMPPTAAELDVAELVGLLPAIELPKRLSDGK